MSGLNESLDSIQLNFEFNQAMKIDDNHADDLDNLEDLKKELTANVSVDEAQKKYFDRKKKFDKQFENTLMNFTINMDFLNRQSEQVSDLVMKAEELQDKTASNIVQMNENLSNVSDALDVINQ